MQFSFSFPVKPLSNNKLVKPANRGMGRLVKTNEARKFQKTIAAYMSANKQPIKELNEFFDENNHNLMAHIKVTSPNFYTKSGRLNKKDIDTGNCEKALIDAMFKFFDFDDVFITDHFIQRRYGKTFCIDVTLHVKDNSDLK